MRVTCLVASLPVFALLGCGARTGLLDTSIAVRDAAVPDAEVPSDAAPVDSGVARVDAAIPIGQRLVLFGGEYASSTTLPATVLGDTWTWDGASWNELDVKGPAARSNAGAGTFDGKLVLFGGSPGTTAYLGDTWEFDGATWTQVDATGPGARVSAHIESLHDTLFLMGGDPSGSTWATDTWSLRGSTWSSVDAMLPGISNGGGGTSLPFQFTVSQSSSILLFGALDDRNEALGTTWRFDGEVWTLFGGLADGAPSGRYGAAVSTLGTKMFVFGGSSDWLGTMPLDDTWLFDGSTWTMIDDGAPHPTGRVFAVSAELDGHVLLFGGWDVNGQFQGETWQFDGSSWTNLGVAGPSPRAAAVMGHVP